MIKLKNMIPNTQVQKQLSYQNRKYAWQRRDFFKKMKAQRLRKIPGVNYCIHCNHEPECND